MLKGPREPEFSGAAEIWQDFASQHPELKDEGFLGLDAVVPDQFRDEYVRLPYDEAPQYQECSW